MDKESSPFQSAIRNNVKYITLKTAIPEQVTGNILHHFQIERCTDGIIKLDVQEDVFKYLETKLNIICNSTELLTDDRNNALIELYRCFRNSSINERSQNFICFETTILKTTKSVIDTIDRNNILMKIILQFLINIITSNRNVGEKVHEEFSAILKTLVNERLHIYECSALLYNISLHVPLESDTIDIMFKLHSESNQSEFVQFFIENCISTDEFWNLYDNLETSQKLISLETIRAQQISDMEYNLPTSAVQIIIIDFLDSPKIFFKINNLTTNEEIREVSLLLEILSCLSSSDKYLCILQENRNIIINASALLINFHKLGKCSGSLFTPIQKLAECTPEDSENPVFGLKVDLIRLVGNLCWKNPLMQNLARESEVIPVILDCCNIDVKNPFIIQWCILAIRNLCDNNIENQRIISGMRREGTVSSQVLNEFGVTLDSDGQNQLKIIPLDSLKQQ
ncbi:unnamed protein product [Phyllotreta striolata]|uniref:Ataxin-10 n=1 Tax=Phyllotreta striolata TaxID=444603 RepID=A0A9N9U0K5_PHYSR|nr:unnamed protein product [Phyllotreta striolata]